MLKPIAVQLSAVKDSGLNVLVEVPYLPRPYELVLKANLSATGDDLSIELVHQRGATQPKRRAAFRFDSLRGDLVVGAASGGVTGDHPPLAGMTRRFMGLAGSGALTAVTSADAPAGFPILKAGSAFVVTTLNQYYGKPLAAPFFYTDAQRSYFVSCAPATTTIYKTIDKLASAAPKTAKASFNASALQDTASLVSAATHDAKPWFRAEARTANLASAAMTQSWVQAAAETSATGPSALSETRAVAKALGPILGLGLSRVTMATVSTTFTPFCHPFVETFTVAIAKFGLDQLFSLETQGATLASAQPFATRYAPDPGQVANATMVEAVDFGVGSPFGVYNYELFMHLPLMLQATHVQNGSPDLGLPWGARVCDLLGVKTDPADAWKFLPFRQETNAPSFGDVLDALSAGPDDPRRKDALAQIEASQLYPFQPFRIARLRPDAMKKYAFLQVFNARLALADQHYARYTPEDVSFALLEYLVLEAALGQKNEVLPSQIAPAKTYAELLPHLDAAGDAVLTIETKLGSLSAVTAPVATGSGQSTNLRLAATRYFCLPPNDKLMNLWDQVAGRLSNIRNGLTIDGARRPLSFFGPKIDPALLVQAAAAGGDINAAADAAASATRPNHRFHVLLRMARERAERLIAINNGLTLAIKEANAEHLMAMRTRHEGEIMGYIDESRKAQIAEAQQALVALAAQRAGVMVRWRHFRQQLGFDDLPEPSTNSETGEISTGQREPTRAFRLVDGASAQISVSTPADPTGTLQLSASASLQSGKILDQEREEVSLSFAASEAQGLASHLHALAALIKIVPEIEAAAKPVGVGVGVKAGGIMLSGIIEAGANEVSAVGSQFAFLASNASKQAAFLWRERDFTLQLNSAAAEALHLDQLIISAQKALATRVADKVINDQQALRTAAVLDYLGSKFSNEDFHLTMATQLTTLQKLTWTVAMDKLNEARDAFVFEFSPLDVPPMPAHIWDLAPKGLLSGEALVLAIQQLESAYMARDRRRLELTRNISLKQLNPFALVRLRETGHCQFELPQALFDLDNPGLYDRRIKDVRVSIPAVAGPYAPVSATLQLLKSETRAKDGTVTQITLPPEGSIIVTSSGREDSGQFQPDMLDDRYGPFEGAGAVMSCTLDLPTELRQFPYRTMHDVILTVRYRADREEGLVAPARQAVAAAMDALKLEGARTGAFHLISGRHDFPDDWRRWERAPDQTLTLTFTRNQLPFPFQQLAKVKSGAVLWAPPGAFLTDTDIASAGAITITPKAGDPDAWEIAIPPPPDAPRDEAYVFLNYAVGSA